MKPIKNLAISTFLIFISLILFSCNNELSRSKAEELITKKFGFPQNETIDIEKIYVKTYYGGVSSMGWPIACLVSGTRYSEVKNWLDDLEQKGLIKVTESGPIGKCNIVQAIVNLTNEGKNYFVSEDKDKLKVKTCEIAFGEITGIQTQEQFKVAEVHYTLKRINYSPFTTNTSNQSINRTASFSFYDDGWRINN